MSLTQAEAAQIRSILEQAERRERATAEASKNSFLSWLRGTAVGWLVGKLYDMAWSAIRWLVFGN